MQEKSRCRAAKRPGRPAIEDEDQILAYFTVRIAAGDPVAQISRGGLAILEFHQEALVVARRLKGPTLERRYRSILTKRRKHCETLRTVLEQDNARYIGRDEPLLPLSFTHGKTLARGRPKKNRAR